MDLEEVIRNLAPDLLRYCTARTRDRSLGVGGGVPGGIRRGVPGGRSVVDFRERLERKTPAVFRFDSVPLAAVLDDLGKIAELEIQTEGQANRPVTVDLSSRTVLAALKTLQEQAGLAGSIAFVESGPGSTGKARLKISPAKPK